MKKRNLKSLTLNKKSISSFDNESIQGGVTDRTSCQTTSCVCPYTHYCFTRHRL